MTGIPSRLTAALADRYAIERELGAGGMATVYLAEDLRHDRKVALKVLRPELAAVLGAERFVQEIKTTASLQHPHVLPLHDSGEADGFLYYVMPFIDGETLRDKLNRETQLGIEEAVRITTEVADALDYAHRHGVIHRDIKPENILLHDGRPLVADFGIALAVSAAAGGRMTETGLSLGTPHYMSPEQAAADKDLTNRSDIYSLGAVLYELLTGNPPHTGASAQQIIMKIVTEDAAPVTQARRTVPPNVAAAVAKALEKLPADRFAGAAEFSRALHTASFTYGTGGPATSVRPRLTSQTGWAGWIVAGVLAAGMGWMLLRDRDAAHAPSYAFTIETLGEDVVEPVVADDGTVVLERDDEIRVRRSAALESAVLHRGEAQTTGIALSPDGQWIAFTTLREEHTELHKIPVTGGVPVSLLSGTPALIWSSPVWGDDGWIYFEGQNFIGRVLEVGGAVDTVLAPGHFHPQDALPGGRGLLLAAVDASSVIALNLTNGDTVTVAPGGVSARWSTTGHVLYVGDEGVLHAVPFDPRAFATAGSPQVVLDGVAPGSPFDLSDRGTLVYNAGAQGARRFSRAEYWWMGLDGTTSRIPIETVEGHTDGALAPDASRIAYIRGGQVHVFDLDLGTDRRVGEGNHDPLWSPDSRRIAFRNDQRGAVMIVASDGDEEPRVLADLRATSPIQWVSDGTILLGSLSGDVRAVDDDPATDAPPRDLFVASWVEQNPAISPDRRWIAYESNEDGVGRAYVRSWPDLSGKTLVSGSDTLADGDRDLFWAPSSRTLHYLTASGAVIAATLNVGNGVEVATRSVVTRLPGTVRVQDLDRRGNRFLVVRSAGDADQPNAEPQPNRLVVITNWFGELRRRVGERP